ncbi:MAG TPA: MASE1 domain-containing protein [Candidatus Baltobacteraceae bacterium]|nr:MASE1 domain-containing protein [Candidatus Baltobacteraceae bacterium]
MEQRKQPIAIICILAAVYFLAGKLGLSMAFVHPSSTAVWPPTGIALAAFLLLGYRVWPGVFIGAFLVNITTAGSVLTSLGVATGNTLESLAAAFLVLRFANGRNAFDRAGDTFRFASLVMASTTIAATIGVTSLSLGGYAPWAHYGSIWATWWLGDGVGAILVAPLLILFISQNWIRLHWREWIELLALMAGLTLVAEIVFGKLLILGARNYPLEYLCIPFLIWAAIRFGQREAVTATAWLSGIAIWGTLRGLGPFAIASKNGSLLLLQAFMGITSAMTLALAAMSAERRRVEEQVHSLAVTDPLTGLANYRMLVDTLDAEIRRFSRTERPFSVLLLDMDGLKQINDTYGHLTGSRALCRLGDILRVHCRSMDTAARYGGDEFAIVIPEADVDDAKRVVRRIQNRVARDAEHPPFTVSIGAAVYPTDGGTREALLAAADNALYEMKRVHHKGLHSLAGVRQEVKGGD